MSFIDKLINKFSIDDEYDDEEVLDEEFDDYDEPAEKQEGFFSRMKSKRAEAKETKAREREEFEEEVKPARSKERPAKKDSSARRPSRSRFDDDDDYYKDDLADLYGDSAGDYYNSDVPVRHKETQPKRPHISSQKKNRPASSALPMVNVIRPVSMEDAKTIADNLIDDRTVLLNLEGLDIDIAQRIIDFTCGTCYSLGGSPKMVSNYIFLFTPKDVDISGDVTSILSGNFDIPSMRSGY